MDLGNSTVKQLRNLVKIGLVMHLKLTSKFHHQFELLLREGWVLGHKMEAVVSDPKERGVAIILNG
jgi:hypothetical protein